MVEVGVVITLIVSIALLASGIIMHLLAASLRHPLKFATVQIDRHEDGLEKHGQRISELEQSTARVEAHITFIADGVKELKTLFLERENRTRGDQ